MDAIQVTLPDGKVQEVPQGTTPADIARKISPRKIVLVHGDPPAVEWIRTQLHADLPNTDVIVPAPGMEVEL